MLLSIKDIELLKLICWCKNIPAPVGKRSCYLYSHESLSVLEHIGLIYKSADKKNIRPRPAAYHLVSDIGYLFKSDIRPQTTEKVLARRNIASQILFTFHRAGVSVFVEKLVGIINDPIYMASFAARQADTGNPFGSTRFYGIFCTAHKAFLVLYADEIGVYYQKELTLFHNLIEVTGIRNTAVIVMGKSTSSIGTAVSKVKTANKKKYNTNSFAQILETTTLPVHFIPIGDAGAQIIRFLLISDYREAMAKSLLLDSYKPPYKDLADTDTIHYKKPYNPAVIAVDMDINRIERALINAQEAGYQKIVIYALPEQTAFLKSRFMDNADVLGVNIENIKRVINCNIDLYEPPEALYVTEEGRCFSVSDFAAYRKVRKSDRTQD